MILGVVLGFNSRDRLMKSIDSRKRGFAIVAPDDGGAAFCRRIGIQEQLGANRRGLPVHWLRRLVGLGMISRFQRPLDAVTIHAQLTGHRPQAGS